MPSGSKPSTSQTLLCQNQSDDFPALGATSKITYKGAVVESSEPTLGVQHQSKSGTKKKELETPVEDFPALNSSTPGNDITFSNMPSVSIFSNPSAHLSVLNKKKNRFQNK